MVECFFSYVRQVIKKVDLTSILQHTPQLAKAKDSLKNMIDFLYDNLKRLRINSHKISYIKNDLKDILKKKMRPEKGSNFLLLYRGIESRT